MKTFAEIMKACGQFVEHLSPDNPIPELELWGSPEELRVMGAATSIEFLVYGNAGSNKATFVLRWVEGVDGLRIAVPI